MKSDLEELAIRLLNADAIRFGEFTLKDGSKSPIYVDLRVLPSYPSLLWDIAAAMWDTLNSSADLPKVIPDNWCFGAIPEAAVPIGVALAIQANIPLVYPRSAAKTHGTGAAMMGVCIPQGTVILVDDVVTTGASKLEAIETFRCADMDVYEILVAVDRGQGGAEELAANGYRVHSLWRLPELIRFYHEEEIINTEVCDRVLDYLKGGN